MLDRILTAIVLVLLAWLEVRHTGAKTHGRADALADELFRIGQRIRRWEFRTKPRRHAT